MARTGTRRIDGALADVVGRLPAGEVRTGQLAMAEATEQMLERDHGVLAVAAGTGTGKSFAYLVPAALSGKRVVVATATKALQDQLANKDLPIVAAADTLDRAGKPLSWAVLKGRSNYLCRQRLRELEAFGRQESLNGAGSESDAAGAGADARRPSLRPSRAATIGEQVPLTLGGARVFAAGLSPDDLDRLLEGVENIPFPSGQVLDRQEFVESLGAIRSRGYAFGEGQGEGGSVSIAVPVISRDGEMLAAIQVSGRIEDIPVDVDSLVAELQRASAAITRRIP